MVDNKMSKFKKKPKFTVGEIIMFDNDVTIRWEVMGNTTEYKLKWAGDARGSSDISSFSHDEVEEICDYYTKRIKATKIAKKLNKGKIIAEKDGYIEVKCE